MGQTLSKSKLPPPYSKTIKKTQDKRTEDNERIIGVRFPRNHLGQEMCLTNIWFD